MSYGTGTAYEPITPFESLTESAYTWIIYKTGSLYKARNGFLGRVPSGGSSDSMDTLWDWLRDNYTSLEVAEGGQARRGLVQFYKGDYTFSSTDGLLIDDNMGDGVGSGTSVRSGVYLRGHRLGTRLIFTPSSAADSGITISNVAESGVENMEILMNTNVTNAIKIVTDTTGRGGRALVDSVKIALSGTEVVTSGQRGVYLSTPTGLGGNSFFSTITRLLTRYIDTGVELAGTSSFNNTHAVNVNDSAFWASTKGVNIGDFCGQNFVYGILLQDISPAAADYAVRIGVSCNYNKVRDITADVMSKTGAAFVLIEDQAGWNKIDGISGSGSAQAVNDLSGQSTNEYSNYITIGATVASTYRMKEGRWSGGPYFTGASAGATGTIMYGGWGQLGAGFLAQAGTEELYAIFTNSITDATEGHASRFTSLTSPTSGDNIGIKSRAFVARRPFHFRLYFRFRVNTANTSSDHRVWFGLWNVDTDFTGDNWLGSSAGLHGIGIGYRLTDTTWQFVRNDGTNGGMQFTDTGVSNQSASVTHQCIIQSEEFSTPRFLINMDGATLTSFTTSIPGNTNLLRLAMGIEINNTSAHSVDIFDIKIDSWK